MLCRGVIKATFAISGLMIFAVIAGVVATKSGFVGSMKTWLEQRRYQSLGDSNLQLS